MHDADAKTIGDFTAHLIGSHSQVDGALSVGSLVATFLHGHRLMGATPEQQEQLFGLILHTVIGARPDLFTAYREESNRMFDILEAELNDKQGATVQ